MIDGWVKAHRALLEHPIIKDPHLARLWLWCLLSANTKASQYRGEQLAPGEFVTGRISASQQLSVSPSKWYRDMQKLEQMGCVRLKANSNWTTVSVCNWGTYQARKETERTADEQQMNNRWTTNEQQMNTEEERKKERKKEVNTYTHDFQTFWKDYPRRQGNPPQGKANAFAQWQKIPPDDLPQVMLALKHYAKTCNGYPKDPERFLKKDFWKDHLAPPTPATSYGTNKLRNGPGQLFDPTSVF